MSSHSAGSSSSGGGGDPRQAQSTSSNNGNGNGNPRDPSGFLNTDEYGRPSESSAPTVVKIVGTARDDLNGLLGFCTAFNRDRERYMVRMASVDPGNSPNATVMALKPANLTKASGLETYRAMFQQLKTDPRVKRKLSEYYQQADTLCRGLPLPAGTKPEHAAGALLCVVVGLVYLLGLTRVIMLSACLVMVGCILADDVLRHRKPWRVVLQNLPSRSNAVLSRQFPFLRGRLSDPVAAGLVGLLVLWTLQSVLSRSPAPAPRSGTTGGVGSRSGRDLSASYASVNRDVLEEFYNLGFKDSAEGRERGHSFAEEVEQLLGSSSSSSNIGDDGDIPYSYSETPHLPLTPPSALGSPPKTFFQKLVSMRTMGSLFYLYRMAMQIGVDHSTGIFSVAQLFSNIQHSMPPWQKGMLAFSCYNLVSNLLF
ncbi:unnamed protein product [Pseudo-nitzschia multistriata]|uniref:Uncharacterized protein n=1 Tax=Pseudo-nitzschia multistriata TaxID=183589 RepID=A0A448ZDZ6_9STRA|nr:unnamed protein product [Pseudo-nitzschia multistriata]